MNAPQAPHISQLRQHLLDTLADLRDRDKPMDPDRARAVAQVAGVLVDSAKVEVEYLKATGQDRAGFLEEGPAVLPAPQRSGVPSAHNPFPGSTQHRMG
ncbi:hypothetical protein [Paracidovorax cattleyae]|uniref:Uncharacterized protein n=1 Tax=Paracidovorax cattleyae TaxID=80868 RepID=A0A1H0N1C0_9BURK|nr:hypothetical protein [Paracidovorax cattleyae]AVS75639.1 hypothetical protein C8240_18080 [Paracidovorax cattleyae]SDO86498.1 hypothetical protein SAMN04489708_104158 [Paracidovorax cattleyae]